MRAQPPSIVLVVREIASDRVLPLASFLSREPLSQGWNCAARPAGGPQGRSRKVTSYVSVVCDSIATAPAEPELVSSEGFGRLSQKLPLKIVAKCVHLSKRIDQTMLKAILHIKS